jgi:hypothetical protein
MADNTAVPGGTDTLATDELTTLNGGASSGVKVQRVKNGYGADGDHRDASDAFPMPTKQYAGTATVTSVAANAASQTVIAANANRRGLILHATAGAPLCYVRLGAAAATSSLGGHTLDMKAGAYYEVPYGYTGEVRAIWAATLAGQGLNVTELT